MLKMAVPTEKEVQRSYEEMHLRNSENGNSAQNNKTSAPTVTHDNYDRTPRFYLTYISFACSCFDERIQLVANGCTEKEVQRSYAKRCIYAPCDFETAIKATGFGKFNVLLVILIVPGQCAFTFEIVTMSYVFPVAQCDLDLSLEQKGTLNALCFAGMLATTMVWGFLCDVIGRRRVLIVVAFLDVVFVFISAFSQNFVMLATTKFLGGLVINGTIAASSIYLAEFHSGKYRARVQLVRALILDSSNIIVAALAWTVLPLGIGYESNHLTLHSWNVFLMASVLAPLTAGLIFCFMPETPKFLIKLGKGDEALEVLRKVYALNTGRPKESYPVTELRAERRHSSGYLEPGEQEAPMSKKRALKNQCSQLKKLFTRQYSKNLTLSCVILFFFLFCSNTIKLWLPQIFQSLNDYFLKHNENAGLCVALDTLQKFKDSETKDAGCTVNISGTVYTNTIILTSSAVVGYVLCLLIVQKLGKKTLIGLLATVVTACTVGLYFCGSVASVLATASVLGAFAGVAANLLLSVAIELFPTDLRAMTLSVVLLAGRGASVFGNLLFPILLRWGCGVPFFTLASLLLASAILVPLLPTTENQALQ